MLVLPPELATLVDEVKHQFEAESLATYVANLVDELKMMEHLNSYKLPSLLSYLWGSFR